MIQAIWIWLNFVNRGWSWNDFMTSPEKHARKRTRTRNVLKFCMTNFAFCIQSAAAVFEDSGWWCPGKRNESTFNRHGVSPLLSAPNNACIAVPSSVMPSLDSIVESRQCLARKCYRSRPAQKPDLVRIFWADQKLWSRRNVHHKTDCRTLTSCKCVMYQIHPACRRQWARVI